MSLDTEVKDTLSGRPDCPENGMVLQGKKGLGLGGGMWDHEFGFKILKES